MFYVLQNESVAARRRVPILLTDAATGTTAQTGLASTQIFPYVNINGGAFAGGAGTIAEAGYGQYYYEFDPSEVATLGLAGIHITAVGCRDYDAISQVAAFNVYSASGVGITAGDVWEYDISGVITAGTAGSQLNLASAGGGTTTGDIATAVWDYAGATNPATVKETLESANNYASNASAQTSSTQIRDAVWDSDISFLNPSTQAGGILYSAAFGATTAGSQVWSYVLSDTNTAEADLVSAASGGAGITAGDVWSFNITGFGGTNSAAVYATQTLFTVGNIETYVSTQTPQDVWSYSGIEGRTLTSGSGISAADVWNYTLTSTGDSADLTLGNVDTNVQTIQGDTSNIPGGVWAYVTRTLTSAAGATAGDIWNYAGGRTITGGIVTSVGDKTGYSLSGTQSFNLTGNITGSLSGSVGSVIGSAGSVVSPVDVSTTSMSGIANTVWTNVSRTTTGGTITDVTNPVAVSTTSMSGIAGTVWATPSKTITGGTVDTVTNPVSITTTSMSGIANTAWTYSPRTLTSGAGSTAGDIWNYVIDGITTSGTAAAQLNDAAVSGSVVTIVNGPYRVTSTAEGSDGVIDILNDSVQPITIYCINGFAQPFNIGGYTASVDIYDEAGGFVKSYTPTIDYALGGILTFNIDTDVTGVIGRYTLVVSLTQGDVVQLGPLTILVRPL